MAASAVVIQQILETRLGLILGKGQDATMLVEKIRKDLGLLDLLEPVVRGKVRLAYGIAIRWSFGMCFCLGTGALLTALFIREKKVT